MFWELGYAYPNSLNPHRHLWRGVLCYHHHSPNTNFPKVWGIVDWAEPLNYTATIHSFLSISMLSSLWKNDYSPLKRSVLSEPPLSVTLATCRLLDSNLVSIDTAQRQACTAVYLPLPGHPRSVPDSILIILQGRWKDITHRKTARGGILNEGW